jgi:hypothetical protein
MIVQLRLLMCENERLPETLPAAIELAQLGMRRVAIGARGRHTLQELLLGVTPHCKGVGGQAVVPNQAGDKATNGALDL